MQQGRNYIQTTNEKKEIIERRNTRHFNKLYRRIANDLINLIQTGRGIDFTRIFENYRPDYIFLFRGIFQDVREAGFGFEIRKQLNFNLSNIIEIKKNIAISEDDQERINDKFDEEYTLLLNNRTEELANNDFIRSEARYFENLYNDSIKEHEEFKEVIRNDIQETNSKLLELSIILGLTSAERERQRILQKKRDALKQQLEELQTNRNKEVLRQFRDKLEEKTPIRSESNTQYATGQATSQIKELEYNTIKQSNVKEVGAVITGGKLLIDRIKKKWWEKSRFVPKATPRTNHVALSGTYSDANGNFYVGGYQIPHPRYTTLPPEESVNCRCEVEYIVI